MSRTFRILERARDDVDAIFDWLVGAAQRDALPAAGREPVREKVPV